MTNNNEHNDEIEFRALRFFRDVQVDKSAFTLVAGTDQCEEDVWILPSLGCKLKYLPWRPLNPDGGTLESCLAVKSGQLVDTRCGEEAYICQIPKFDVETQGKLL